MFRRSTGIVLLAAALALLAGCHHNKVANPIANVDSKQPDKVLFDRAMDAMQHGKYDVARLTLQTLINTYPDSEFIARAKLAVGDSWYAEGTTAAYAQAEEEYSQFQVFFPNMAEAAEAQKKIGDIHFKQMEKADRDPTQALKAEDAYRQLVLQYPDSKLVPEAKEKLREVQEVLADREFEIGHFYYIREAYPAAVARLKTLTDTYPLYSQADEALYLLGNSYERIASNSRAAKVPPQIEKLPDGPAKQMQIEAWKTLSSANASHFDDLAAEAYSKLITQYPVMDRAKDARERLEALHRPVPTPTQDAIARNKAEQESRGTETKFGAFLSAFHHGPDLAEAAHVGEPTLDQPPVTSATDIVNAANEAMKKAIPGASSTSVEAAGAKGNSAAPASGAAGENSGSSAGAGTSSGTSGGSTSNVSVQPVGNGASANGANSESPAQPALQPPSTTPAGAQPASQPAAEQPKSTPAQPDNGIEELKPNVPTETTPAPGTGGNAQPPAQIRTGITSQESGSGSNTAQPNQQDQAQQTQQDKSDSQTSDQASSKNNKNKKKKKQQPPQ